jgi:hypothetical protein
MAGDARAAAEQQLVAFEGRGASNDSFYLHI